VNLGDFPYYREITIENMDGMPENYQLKVVLDNATHMASDFKDLLFVETLNNDRVGLPYWIENYNAGENAVVWVKKYDNTDNTIYVWYGNSNAPDASNGSSVFIDFLDHSSASEWDNNGTATSVTDNDTFIYFYSSGNTGNVKSPPLVERDKIRLSGPLGGKPHF